MFVGVLVEMREVSLTWGKVNSLAKRCVGGLGYEGIMYDALP